MAIQVKGMLVQKFSEQKVVTFDGYLWVCQIKG